jgi:hypothetical protein
VTVNSHLALVPTGRDPIARSALSALRAVTAVEDALLVLVAAPDAGPALRACLPELVESAARRGASRLVVAASGLAAAAADTGRPAQRIADETGLTIVAPDAMVSIHRSGALWIRDRTDDGQPGSWWACPPEGEAGDLGPCWPPAAARLVGAEIPGGVEDPDHTVSGAAAAIEPPPCGLPGWTVEAVAEGLRLRPMSVRGGDTGAPLGIDADRPLLLVGEPGRTLPDAVWEQIPPLAARLTVDAAARPGLVVLAAESEQTAAVARVMCRLHGLEWVGFHSPAVATRASAVAGGAGSSQPANTPATPATPSTTALAGIASAAHVPEVPNHAGVVQPAIRVGAAEPAETPGSRSAPTTARLRVPNPAHRPAAGAGCTDADRNTLREALGSEYVRLASRADQVATRLPGLRTATRQDLRPELVAVLLYHMEAAFLGDRASLAAAARGGSAETARLAYLSCLTAGLRRLPSHRGCVFLGAAHAAGVLDAYRPGAVLAEPAAVCASPSADAALGAPVEFAVWSSTGRRTNLFAAQDEEPEVVFPPGTCFRVLEVVPGASLGAGPDRVLLREADPGREAGAEDLDRSALQRLRQPVEKRAALVPDELRLIARPHRFHLAPGLEES